MAGRHRRRGTGSTVRRSNAGRHDRRRTREPYQWLGKGAVALGLGAALINGIGIASADGESSTTAKSPAASGESSGSRADRGQSEQSAGDRRHDVSPQTRHTDSPEASIGGNDSAAGRSAAAGGATTHESGQTATDAATAGGVRSVSRGESPGPATKQASAGHGRQAAPATQATSSPVTGGTATGATAGLAAGAHGSESRTAPRAAVSAMAPASSAASLTTSTAIAPVPAAAPSTPLTSAATPTVAPLAAGAPTTAGTNTASGPNGLQPVVTGVLGMLGIGPASAPKPLSPLALSPLADLANAWFRRIEATVTSQTPTAISTQTSQAATPALTAAVGTTVSGIANVQPATPDASATGAPLAVTTAAILQPNATTPSTASSSATPLSAGPAASAPAPGTATGPAVIDQIRLGNVSPFILSPDGGRLYVANYDGNGSVDVVDTKTDKIIDTITTNGQGAIALSSDGKHLYALTPGGILNIDTNSDNAVGKPIPVGSYPETIAISPDGRHIFVEGAFNASVRVVDTSTGDVTITRVPSSNIVGGLTFSSDSAHVYYTNSNSPQTISVLDGSTGAIISTIPANGYPLKIVMSPDGSRAYVASDTGNGGMVSAIDTASNTIIGAPIPVGQTPQNLVFSPDGKRVYVSNYRSGTISVIDVANNTTVGDPIAVGQSPWQLAVSGDSSRLYVLDWGSHTYGTTHSVYVIDTNTNSVVGAPISVTSPDGYNDAVDLKIGTDGSRLYVLNQHYGLTVIGTGTQNIDGGATGGSGDSGTGGTSVSGAGSGSSSQGDILTNFEAWVGTNVHNGLSWLGTNLQNGATWLSTNLQNGETWIATNGSAAINGAENTVSSWIAAGHDAIFGPGTPPDPTPTQALYDHLRTVTSNATDGVYTEVRDLNGQKVVVAYLGGTTPQVFTDNQSIERNIPSFTGAVDEKQVTAIQNAVDAAVAYSRTSTIPIMLVGYSQGGMDAQNLASQVRFRNGVVTDVVTYASPIISTSKNIPNTVRFVDLIDNGDFVPKFSSYNSEDATLFANDLANNTVFADASANDGALVYNDNAVFNIAGIFGTHTGLLALHGDWSTYEQVAHAFDDRASSVNSYAQIQNAITTYTVSATDFSNGTGQ